jgi:adenylyltransferase/sulfurtransferase
LVGEITSKELSAKLAAGATVVLLDVRQPAEHDTAALPGSILIPLNELPSRADELELPQGALLIVYCHHGIRSLSAAEWLAHRGHGDVVSLRGGIDAWSREVDPTVPRY